MKTTQATPSRDWSFLAEATSRADDAAGALARYTREWTARASATSSSAELSALVAEYPNMFPVVQAQTESERRDVALAALTLAASEAPFEARVELLQRLRAGASTASPGLAALLEVLPSALVVAKRYKLLATVWPEKRKDWREVVSEGATGVFPWFEGVWNVAQENRPSAPITIVAERQGWARDVTVALSSHADTSTKYRMHASPAAVVDFGDSKRLMGSVANTRTNRVSAFDLLLGKDGHVRGRVGDQIVLGHSYDSLKVESLVFRNLKPRPSKVVAPRMTNLTLDSRIVLTSPSFGVDMWALLPSNETKRFKLVSDHRFALTFSPSSRSLQADVRFLDSDGQERVHTLVGEAKSALRPWTQFSLLVASNGLIRLLANGELVSESSLPGALVVKRENASAVNTPTPNGFRLGSGAEPGPLMLREVRLWDDLGKRPVDLAMTRAVPHQQRSSCVAYYPMDTSRSPSWLLRDASGHNHHLSVTTTEGVDLTTREWPESLSASEELEISHQTRIYSSDGQASSTWFVLGSLPKWFLAEAATPATPIDGPWAMWSERPVRVEDGFDFKMKVQADSLRPFCLGFGLRASTCFDSEVDFDLRVQSRQPELDLEESESSSSAESPKSNVRLWLRLSVTPMDAAHADDAKLALEWFTNDAEAGKNVAWSVLREARGALRKGFVLATKFDKGRETLSAWIEHSDSNGVKLPLCKFSLRLPSNAVSNSVGLGGSTGEVTVSEIDLVPHAQSSSTSSAGMMSSTSPPAQVSATVYAPLPAISNAQPSALSTMGELPPFSVACPECTFFNPIGATTCGACSRSLPSPSSNSSKTPPPPPTGPPPSAMATTTSRITCSTCTFANPEGVTKCQMCDASLESGTRTEIPQWEPVPPAIFTTLPNNVTATANATSTNSSSPGVSPTGLCKLERVIETLEGLHPFAAGTTTLEFETSDGMRWTVGAYSGASSDNKDTIVWPLKVDGRFNSGYARFAKSRFVMDFYSSVLEGLTMCRLNADASAFAPEPSARFYVSSIDGRPITGEKQKDLDDFRDGATGLVNMQEGLTNVCYQNAVIQALHATEGFRQACLETRTAGTAVDCLNNIFAELTASDRPVSTTLKLQDILPRDWTRGEQMDASDFLNHLLTEVVPNDVVESAFQLETGKTLKCTSCAGTSISKEKHLGLQLGFPSQYTAITGILVLYSEPNSLEPPVPPAGYDRLDNPLNPGKQKAHPSARRAWLCVSRLGPPAQEVTELNVTIRASGDVAPPPGTWQPVGDGTLKSTVTSGANMNEGGQQHVALYAKREPNASAITEIRVITAPVGSSSNRVEPPEGFRVISTNLNPVSTESAEDCPATFLCYRRGLPVTDVSLGPRPPSSGGKEYHLIDVRLRAKPYPAATTTTNEDVYLWFSGARARAPVTNLFLVPRAEAERLVADSGGQYELCGPYVFSEDRVLCKERGHGSPITMVDVVRAPKQRSGVRDARQTIPLMAKGDAVTLDDLQSSSFETVDAVVRSALGGEWLLSPTVTVDGTAGSSAFPSELQTGLTKCSLSLASTEVCAATRVYRVLGQEISTNLSTVWDGVLIESQGESRFMGKIFEDAKSFVHVDAVLIQDEETTSLMGRAWAEPLAGASTPASALLSESIDVLCEKQPGQLGNFRGPIVEIATIKDPTKLPAGFELMSSGVAVDASEARNPFPFHICYRRRDLCGSEPAITRIGVVFPEVEVLGPEESWRTHTSAPIDDPSGPPSNLNADVPGLPAFLCYQVAEDAKQLSPAVFGLGLIPSSLATPGGDRSAVRHSVQGAIELNFKGSVLALDGGNEVKRALHATNAEDVVATKLSGVYRVTRGTITSELSLLCAHETVGAFPASFVTESGESKIDGVLVDLAPGATSQKWSSTAKASSPPRRRPMSRSGGATLTKTLWFAGRWRGQPVDTLVDAELQVEYVEAEKRARVAEDAAPRIELVSNGATLTGKYTWKGTVGTCTFMKDDYEDLVFARDTSEFWVRGERAFADRSRSNELGALVEHYLASQAITMSCDKCGANDEVFVEHTTFETPAPYLVLSLKRFFFDQLAQRPVKLLATTKFDPVLALRGGANGERVYEFGVYAVLVHDGSTANSGHYYAYVRSARDAGPQGLRAKDAVNAPWLLLNDEVVRRTDFDAMSKSIQASATKTVYMLFYKRLDGDDAPPVATAPSAADQRLSEVLTANERFVMENLEGRASDSYRALLRRFVE